MSYSNIAVLDALPSTEEVLTPRQFLKLSEDERAKIKTVRIEAPRLGDKGFGGVRVYYKNTIYRVIK